jgi:hypothetical protein
MAVTIFPQISLPGVSSTGPVNLSRTKTAPSQAETERQLKMQARAAATQPAAATETTPEGMTLNMGDSKEDAPILNEQQYYENLHKAGLGQFAQEEQARTVKLQQDQMVLENQQTMHMISGLDTAMGLAFAGKNKLALATANRYAPEGRQVTEFRVIDKDNIFIRSEDTPEGEVINRLEHARTMTDAKTKMAGFFDPEFKIVGDKRIISQKDKLTGEVKVLATVDSGGASDPKKMEQANILWREWMKESAPYLEKSRARNNAIALAKQDNVAGDVGVLFNYITSVQPPGSKITDQDFQTAESAKPFVEKVGLSWDVYSTLWEGGRITPTSKKWLLDSIEALYKAEKGRQIEVVDKTFYARRDAAAVPPALFDVEPMHKPAPGFAHEVRRGTVKSGPNKGKTAIEMNDGTVRYE